VIGKYRAVISGRQKWDFQPGSAIRYDRSLCGILPTLRNKIIAAVSRVPAVKQIVHSSDSQSRGIIEQFVHAQFIVEFSLTGSLLAIPLTFLSKGERSFRVIQHLLVKITRDLASKVDGIVNNLPRPQRLEIRLWTCAIQ